jgi:hypothetical protein
MLLCLCVNPSCGPEKEKKNSRLPPLWKFYTPVPLAPAPRIGARQVLFAVRHQRMNLKGDSHGDLLHGKMRSEESNVGDRHRPRIYKSLTAVRGNITEFFIFLLTQLNNISHVHGGLTALRRNGGIAAAVRLAHVLSSERNRVQSSMMECPRPLT